MAELKSRAPGLGPINFRLSDCQPSKYECVNPFGKIVHDSLTVLNKTDKLKISSDVLYEKH